jgi:putative colanic acid biosynthesis acetyltransferase WcaF
VTAGDGAEIYNPAPMHFGSHAIVSQGAYICGATHDFDDPAFPLLAYSMTIGSYAWICARASVCPGVHVGEYAVLGLGSVATRDLEPWGVYAGVPAVKVKTREFKRVL